MGEAVGDELELASSDLIQRYPLAKQTARFQSMLRPPIVVDSVEVAGLAFPGHEQVGDNDVKSTVGSQQIMSCIVDLNLHLGMIDDSLIVIGKVSCSLDDFGNQLHRNDLLDFVM